MSKMNEPGGERDRTNKTEQKNRLLIFTIRQTSNCGSHA